MAGAQVLPFEWSQAKRKRESQGIRPRLMVLMWPDCDRYLSGRCLGQESLYSAARHGMQERRA